jgi:hypothetical protein
MISGKIKFMTKMLKEKYEIVVFIFKLIYPNNVEFETKSI